MLSRFVAVSVLYIWCFNSRQSQGSDVPLWGVPPSEIHLYDPDKDFRCKDRTTRIKIPYSKVNDDYCDCPDGSDEPSTSACANGVFYCANIGHVGYMIPSSRVNDGQCDCCDGSDEYSSASCVNNCEELGEEQRKKAEERILTVSEEDEEEDDNGYRPNIVHANNRNFMEKLERLKKLELEKAETEELTKDLEERTNHLEKLANEALEPYQDTPVFKKRKEPIAEPSVEERYVQETFNELDLDKNGVLDIQEIKSEKIFDLNKNNNVEDKEMKWFFDAMPGIANLELFRRKMWKKIGRLYVLEKEMDKSFSFYEKFGGRKDEKHADAEMTKEERMKEAKRKKAEEQEREDEIEREIEDLEDEVEDLNEEDINYTEKTLDDETRKITMEAMDVRRQLNEAKKKLESLRKEKEWAEKTLNDPDFGEEEPESEISEHLENFGPSERSKYFPLRMHCFKYTTKDHVYRLCPFWGASQTDKYRKGDGVDLGRWVGWGREKGEPIMVFKYGAECENGQQRSTKVNIYCGSKNLLVHVEEPRPCQYRMEFKSPAGCHIKHLKEANVTITSHDEL